jgi:hypothetical protein
MKLPGAGRAAGRMNAGFSAEQLFLIECIRCALGGIRRRDVPAAGPDPDWELVVDMALKQSIAPLVYVGIAGSSRPVPAATVTRLRTAYLGAVVWTDATLEPVLRGALRALAGAGLKPILLKGAALANTVYPEPALRTMGDIDLLVSSSERDRAGEALRRFGFSPRPGYATPWHHLPPLRSPDGDMVVELHDQLVPVSAPCCVDLEAVYSRSEEIDVAGIRALVLSPVDALHHVCLHTSWGHRYERFPMRALADVLALAAQTGRDMDWDLLLKVTRRSRSDGAVYWPLRLSRDWLGAPVPEYVLSHLSPPWPVQRLLAAAADPEYILDGSMPAGEGNEVLYRALLGLSLHGGLSARQQLAALLRDLFPSPECIGHLPQEVTRSRFRYAAYLSRPARVARGVIALGRLAVRGPNA